MSEIYFCVSFAQSAVVLAMILKTKDKKLKDIAIPAFISGLFGVTEPCIYGITLPKKKPFVISCIGITTDKGAEVIIHVGMDTVQLEGKGFNPVVKQGDKVKRGDLLLEFDLDLIKAAGYSTETPIVIRK